MSFQARLPARRTSWKSCSAVDGVPTRDVATDAYAIADVAGVTVYDAAYLALAARLDTELITADAKLYSRVRPMPLLAERVRLL